MKRLLLLFIPLVLAATSTFAAEMAKGEMALFKDTIQAIADNNYPAFQANRHSPAKTSVAEKTRKILFDQQVKLVAAKLKARWVIVPGSIEVLNGPPDRNSYTLKIQCGDETGLHRVDFATDQNGKWTTFTIQRMEK